jgi:hypothetical protein
MHQRPTYDLSSGSIIYYKDNAIRQYDVGAQSDRIIGQAKPRAMGIRSSPLDPPPAAFAYNESQNMILVASSSLGCLRFGSLEINLHGSPKPETQFSSGICKPKQAQRSPSLAL